MGVVMGNGMKYISAVKISKLTQAIHLFSLTHRIWPVWRKPHQYTPDQPGVYDHVNLKTLTNADE